MKKISRLYIILILSSIVAISLFYMLYNSIKTAESLDKLFYESAKNHNKDTLFLLSMHLLSKNIMVGITEEPSFELAKKVSDKYLNSETYDSVDIEEFMGQYSIKEIHILDGKKNLLYEKSHSLSDIPPHVNSGDRVDIMLDYMIDNDKKYFTADIFDRSLRDRKGSRHYLVFYRMDNRNILMMVVKENHSLEVINPDFEIDGFEMPEAVEYIILKDKNTNDIYFKSRNETKEAVLNSYNRIKIDIYDEDLYEDNDKIKGNTEKKDKENDHKVTEIVQIGDKKYLEMEIPFFFPDVIKGSVTIGINTDTLSNLKSVSRTNTIISSIIFAILLTGVIFFLVKQDNMAMMSKAHKEKYNSLVVMSKQIAHEIRNPLNSLNMIAKNIQYEKEEGNVSEESIEFLYDRVNAIDNIIKDFNMLTGNMSLEKSSTNIKLILEKIIKHYEKEYPQISFFKKIDDEQVYIDSPKMEQALRNIILNSIEAMTKNENPIIEITSSMNRNNEIEIMVIDNGEGIPNHVLDNLYNPFNTTKAGGSGLGLTIIKKIVDAHNGTIKIRNRKDGGVEVKITFPTK